MPKRYCISEEKVAELENARKKNKNKNIDRRLKAIILYSQGESRAEISEKTGFVPKYVGELVSKYMKSGIGAIAGNHYTGNHRNMSHAEEEALLEPYKKAAEEGQLVEIIELKQAYEKATGRPLENNNGQIYRVLKRHGWRKVMPRSKHPNKASSEAIEASKKLTQLSKLNWEIFQQTEV